jgi:hypothetical protein
MKVKKTSRTKSLISKNIRQNKQRIETKSSTQDNQVEGIQYIGSANTNIQQRNMDFKETG